MKGFLLPGANLKRWFLMLGGGILLLIIFILLAFGNEFQILLEKISRQFYILFQFRTEDYGIRLIFEIILLITGIVFIIIGGKKILDFFMTVLLPEKKGKIMNLISKGSLLQAAPHVVVIGGGTGLNSILRGLKKLTNNITAIVSVSDEGGSSRKLRYEFGMLPPGDIRNCIVALSDSSPEMAKLLEYRFKEGEGLKGHAFGNLLITALTKTTGSFDKAILETSKILAIRGKVLPVSLGKTQLCAKLENGKTICEEPNVEVHKTKYKSEISKLFLKPEVSAFAPALKEIAKADIIVLGPGSLYTSILPNLLVKGIPEAIKKSRAKKVFITNVMTQPGETDNYTAEDHVAKIVQYLGEDVLDVVIVNTGKAQEEAYRKYRKSGATRVKYHEDELRKFNVDVEEVNLITYKNLLRHDPDKLARAVLGLR